MIGEPAASGGTSERAEELGARVHPDRRSANLGGRTLRDQRRQHGFEQVECCEKERQRDTQRDERMQPQRERDLRGKQDDHRAVEQPLAEARAVDVAQERVHQRERHHQNGQIDDPVALRGQPGVAQRKRNLREERHKHRVQGERAEVETQQLGVGDNACKLTGNDGPVIGPVIGIGHRVADHGNRGDGENAR